MAKAQTFKVTIEMEWTVEEFADTFGITEVQAKKFMKQVDQGDIDTSEAEEVITDTIREAVEEMFEE